VTGVADCTSTPTSRRCWDYNTNFKSVGPAASLYAPDEFRVSDHDPVVVGLDSTPSPERPSHHGHGWILSPAGAYPGRPSATGKAQFEFDVKYSKQSALGGTASFTFVAGGFSFSATTFDRLVTSASLPPSVGTDREWRRRLPVPAQRALMQAPDRFRLQV